MVLAGGNPVGEIHPTVPDLYPGLCHGQGALQTPAQNAQQPHTGAQDNIYILSAAHTVRLYN